MKKLVLLPLYWIITVSYGQWVDPAPAGGNIHYNNGNVGIGTDTPMAPLHLNGNMNIPFTFTLAESSQLTS